MADDETEGPGEPSPRVLGDSVITLGVMAICVVLVFVLTPPGRVQEDGSAPPASTSEPDTGAIRPIPLSIDLDLRKVDLGRRLFHDPGLSGDGSISCASCHDLTRGGGDGRIRAVGIRGQLGEVNAPTVLNSGLSFRQFWDGRAASLEEQVDGPLEHPAEMGGQWSSALDYLAADPEYVADFTASYPGGITRESVRSAIATFERSLITPNSAFDRFLRGEPDAIDDQATEGWNLFQSYGCVGCHQGVALGGNMFQRLGVVRDYFAERGEVTRADLGRFNVTGQEEDRYVFKVPSLRNVALTAPYFHDGSAATLHEAVTVMARYQLGRNMAAADRDAIVAFLRTLTGELGASS